MKGPIKSRPDSSFSFGVQHGLLARGYRDGLADSGLWAGSAEWGLEVTYSDKLAPYLTLQPDAQYVRRAYSDGGTRTALVFGLRVIFAETHD